MCYYSRIVLTLRAVRWLLTIALVVWAVPTHVTAMNTPAAWYEQAPLDTDGNKLDDLLDNANPDAAHDVFVCFRYDCIPADRLTELDGMGNIGYSSTSVPAVQVYNISLSDLQNVVALWPEVGFICPNEEASYYMTTAGEAIKAHSGFYSPGTCEDQGFDGTGVTIAIVDSGVEDLLHSDLPTAVGGLIMQNGQTGQLVQGNPTDVAGHGTLVAGCALGRGNGLGQNRGTAPGASLFDARVADAGGTMTMASILAVTDWILRFGNSVSPPIRVVNYSVGFDRASGGSNPLTQAINQFSLRNMTAVVGIGNHGTCDTTAFGTTAGVGATAVAAGALTVGAADHNGTVDRSDDVPSDFSRVGPGLGPRDKPDVVAYGGQCTADCPDGCQPGSVSESITTTNMSGGYSNVTGTSFATPQVSGLCASFLQAHAPSTNSPAQLLRLTAQDIGPPGWDSLSGFGIVDPAAIVGMGQPIPPTPCDLEVQYVNYAPQPIKCGQPTLILVAVKNVGPVPVDTFTVDFKRYYFGPNSAPAVLFDIGNGPEPNTLGPLMPDSVRNFTRWWTPGVSDSLPLSQHACFWGFVDAPCDPFSANNKAHKNFDLTGLVNNMCGPPPPSPPHPKGDPNHGFALADDTLEIQMAVSHDKGVPVDVDVIVENPDPGNWHVELVSSGGDVGTVVPVLVDPLACQEWVTLRAYRLDPAYDAPVEITVISNSDDHGVLGDATVLIDPNLPDDCCTIVGDVDGDGTGPNITDLVSLVAYLFQGGDPPDCLEEADINGDGVGPNITDLTYLVAYMFTGGEPPAPCP